MSHGSLELCTHASGGSRGAEIRWEKGQHELVRIEMNLRLGFVYEERTHLNDPENLVAFCRVVVHRTRRPCDGLWHLQNLMVDTEG